MCWPTTSSPSMPAGTMNCWRSSCQGLIALDFEIEVTGFSPAEIEIVLDEARESSPNGLAEAEDEVLLRVGGPASAVTRPGKDDRQLCAQEAQPLAHRNAALQ
jgi:hypothetical protein